MKRGEKQTMLADLWSQQLRGRGSVQFGPDVLQLVYMIVGGVAMLAGGIAIAVGNQTSGPVIFGAVLAVLGAVLLAYTGADLVRGKLVMTVTADGVEVGPRRFAWAADVERVAATRSNRSALVALFLTPEAAARLPRSGRRGSRFYLPSVNSVPSPVLATWLDSVRAAASDAPPTPRG